MYTTTPASASSFFSRGGPRLAAPLKNLSSQTRQAAPSLLGIRQLAPGGKARAFADIVGDRLGQSEQRQFQNLANTLIPYVTGDSLDLLGEIYGVPRLGQSSVQSDLADRNFEFYVRRGTFGDINGGNPIEIPSDVRISTGEPKRSHLPDRPGDPGGRGQPGILQRPQPGAGIGLERPGGGLQPPQLHRLHGLQIRHPSRDQPLRPGGGKRCRVGR